MKAENISLVIASVCKELGINYCSTNPHIVTLHEDAKKLGKVYLWLKEIVGIMKEIEDRHNLNGLRQKFEHIINELDNADHAIIKLARELKDKNDS